MRARRATHRTLCALGLAALAGLGGAAFAAEPVGPAAASAEALAALLPPPPPAPRDLLERLPPGSRSTEAQGEGVRVEADLARGDFVVERVPNPWPEGAAPDWFEVEYSVDPHLEARVRDVLARKQVGLAHVILMDPATGEVFAYVSTAPDVFPATRPYPTASLMKVVTAAAVLRRAPEATGRRCRYEGSPWELRPAQLEPPDAGGRVETFRHALAMSNNQCFARLAVHDLGEEALLDEMRRLGLLESAGPAHPAGRVEDRVGGALGLGYLGSGLAGSFITPLGAARLAAVLAEGMLVQPWWVARVRDARGELLALPERPAPRRVLPRELAHDLREVMVDVTEHGTAARGFHGLRGAPMLGPVRVAGKTGTLSGTDPPGRYQWFIGVAPAEDPRVAIATVVVSNPPGGASASSVAAASLREVFCEREGCAATRAEPLRERTRERESEVRREIAARHAREAARAAEARALVAASDLDHRPRPLDATGLEFPRHLRRQKVDGEIVLLVELTPEGEVMDVAVDSSDLPDFDAFVASQVRGWRFTPPTAMGRPVHAQARLPIAIRIH
jgi:TonB family protein